jgi:hypothetical protein
LYCLNHNTIRTLDSTDPEISHPITQFKDLISVMGKTNATDDHLASSGFSLGSLLLLFIAIIVGILGNTGAIERHLYESLQNSNNLFCSKLRNF